MLGQNFSEDIFSIQKNIYTSNNIRFSFVGYIDIKFSDRKIPKMKKRFDF